MQSLLITPPCDGMCVRTQAKSLSLVSIVKISSARPATCDSICVPTQGKSLSLVNIAKHGLLSLASCDVICIPTQGISHSLVSIVKQGSFGPPVYDSMCAPTQGEILHWPNEESVQPLGKLVSTVRRISFRNITSNASVQMMWQSLFCHL